MATKKELYQTAVTKINEVGKKFNLSSVALAAILAVADEVLKPKKGGAKVDLSEVTKVDDKGTVVKIKCSVSGVWLPADKLNFYETSKGGVKGYDGSELRRSSREGTRLLKEFNRTTQASKEALMSDFSEPGADIPKLQAKLRELNASKPDFSVIKPITATTTDKEPEGKETPAV